MGVGILLQLVGLFLVQTWNTAAIFGLVLIGVSLPVFTWGCMNYAEGKGHSKWVGLIGVAGIIGLIVLIILLVLLVLALLIWLIFIRPRNSATSE